MRSMQDLARVFPARSCRLTVPRARGPRSASRAPSRVPSRNMSISVSRPSQAVGRTYESSVDALNSLQSNAKYISKLVKEGVKATNDDNRLLPCSQMIGLGPQELSNLSVIHVAGTKGKGSTSAYCESILRHHGFRTGFFSSPHLVSVRERIRLNGQPLSAEKFTHYFWNTFDLLQDNKISQQNMPPYFEFLTLMALKVFLGEQVDVAIVEVGIGGECDSTNILQNVSVVGITSLGIDHTALLGNTLSSIAWQKAGIFKPSAVGFTVPGHPSEALKVLGERSVERKCPVNISPPLDQYTWPDAQSQQAALSLFWTQQLNASLALQLTKAWMERNGNSSPEVTVSTPNLILKDALPFTIPKATAAGLFACRWPGRNQILKSNCGKIQYFLDGAHTIESMEACVKWYKSTCPNRPGLQHALIFNMTGDRDRLQIMKPLLSCTFDQVIFSPNIFHSSSSSGDSLNLRVSLSNQLKQTQNLYNLWKSETEEVNGNVIRNLPATALNLTNSVNEALAVIQGKNTEWCVLVTGSLHLVGAVLSVIDPNLEK